MKRSYVCVIIILAVGMMGFSDNPKVPEMLKIQLLKFLDESSKVDSMIKTGTSYANYQDQFYSANAAYELLKDMSESLDLDISTQVDLLLAQRQLDGAFMYWLYALKLWDLKIAGTANESYLDGMPYLVVSGGEKYAYNSFNTFNVFKEYLKIEEKGEGACEEVTRCIPFTPNIEVLLAKGSVNFDEGKEKILAILN
jgi:hypothetical protein